MKVAYNPDDVSNVWLIKNGSYIRFELIESRYAGKQLLEVQQLQEEKKSLVQAAETASIQAQIDLAAHILNIADNAIKHENTDVKGIRETRKRESLSKEQTELYEKLRANLNERMDLSTCDAFTVGFKIGVRIMNEATK